MTPSTLVFLFPGQGAQKTGMGEGLFDRFPELTAAADAELGYSIRELCLRDPLDQLGRTDYTQPALFTVNALTYYKTLEDSKRTPHFVAGHSLGEYNALLAAGAFDFRTGLKLVKKRGQLMSQALGGGMGAVVGLSLDQIRNVIQRSNLANVSVANLNAPQQAVVSGPKEEILHIGPMFEAAGAKLYKPLNVSGAFHSPFMQPARQEFESFLKQFQFSAPKIPVISNAEAAPYPPGQIADLLARQITSPVRWVESIQFLMKQPEPTFEEIGPGNILKGLLRQIVK